MIRLLNGNINYINMKYKQRECYAKTHWYDASVVFFEDTDDEIEIECSVEVNEDDNTDSVVMSVHVINPEDIPEGHDEEDIADFVIENFE